MFTDKSCDRIRRFMIPLVSVANQARCDSRDRSDDGAPQSKPEVPGLQESKANFSRKLGLLGAFICLALPRASLGADAKAVSFFHDVVPILKRSCTGCHHPAKLKGELDLTTYAAFQKGGKHGPAFKPETPEESRVIEEISGEEPNMQMKAPNNP